MVTKKEEKASSPDIVLQLRVALAISDLKEYKWRGERFQMDTFDADLENLPTPLIQSILTHLKKNPSGMDSKMCMNKDEKEGNKGEKSNNKNGKEKGKGSKVSEGISLDTQAAIEQSFRGELERISQGQFVKSSVKRRTNKLNARELAFYGATKQAHKIPVATKQKMQQRIPGELYFIVDTSGSVSTFGEMISTMLMSASSSRNIHVWTGSEARPTHKLEKAKKIEINQYGENLVVCVASWVKSQKVPKGSTLVFWGDQEDTPYKSAAMKIATEGCNLYWLSPQESENSNGIEAKKAGFNTFYGISSPKKFSEALKKIKIIPATM